MNSPATSTPNLVAARSKLPLWLAWGAILAVFAYFLLHNVPRYFVFTEQSYGNYFWGKRGWLLPHVVCGLLAAVLGPLQFWPGIRQRYLGFHRIAGRIYVTGVLLGAIAGLGLASTLSKDDAAYAGGLSSLAVAWLLTTGMAFVAIRRKNIPQHKQWMIRSYVVTFAFVSFRLVNNLMAAGHLLSNHERSTLLAWGCWAVPLLLTEVALQSGAVFKKRA